MKAKSKQFGAGLVAAIILLVVALMAIGAAPQWSGASPLAPTANEVEPNDGPANANSIMVSDLMFGDIETTSDVDYYVLDDNSRTKLPGHLDPARTRRTTNRHLQIRPHSSLWRCPPGHTASVSFNFTAQDTLYYLRVSIGGGFPTVAGPPDYDYQLQID